MFIPNTKIAFEKLPNARKFFQNFQGTKRKI